MYDILYIKKKNISKYCRVKKLELNSENSFDYLFNKQPFKIL